MLSAARPDDLVRPAREAAWLIAAAALLLLLALGANLLNDSDTQWHVAAGRLMWRAGAVPLTDPFSHTFAGAPWISKEPLSQLLLYAAFAAGGWVGVTVLTASAIALAFALLARWTLERVRWSAALAMLGFALALSAPQFLARPHCLVLPVQVLVLSLLASARERGTAPSLWIPVLMTVWANMHASYPIGLCLASLFAAEALAGSAPGRRVATLVRWGAVLALAGLAILVSPYGYRSVLIVLTVVRTDEVMRYVQEWQPIGFDAQGCFAVAALAASLLLLMRHPRANAFRILTVGLLGFMMVRHVRFTLLFGMLTPVIVAGPLRRNFPLIGPVPFRLPAARLAAAGMAGLALVVAVEVEPRPGPSVAAPAALAFARSQCLDGPVYNDYDFGGFLMMNGVRTFIDGRNDQLFLGGFTDRLNQALADAKDERFAAVLDAADVQWALVKPGTPDQAHLARLDGWSERYRDRNAAVYVRTTGMPLRGTLSRLAAPEPSPVHD